MTRGRPKKSISAHDQRVLSKCVASCKLPRLRKRAKAVLLSADLANTIVARRMRVSALTVSRWRQRFLHGGLDGLRDALRSGRSSLTEREVRKILRYAEGYVWHRRSTRTAAAKLWVSRMSVWRVWNAHGVRPAPFFSWRTMKRLARLERAQEDREALARTGPVRD